MRLHRPHLLRLGVRACVYVRPPPFPLRPTPPMAHPARPRRAARASRGFPASLATGASHRHRGPTDAVTLGALPGAQRRGTHRSVRGSPARAGKEGGGAPPCSLIGPCLFGSPDTWLPRGVRTACSCGCWRPQTARNQVLPPTRPNRGRPPHPRWFGGGLRSGPSRV